MAHLQTVLISKTFYAFLHITTAIYIRCFAKIASPVYHLANKGAVFADEMCQLAFG